MAFFYVYTYFLTVGVKIIAYKINQLQKYFLHFVGRIIKYYTIALTKSIKTNQNEKLNSNANPKDKNN